MMNTRVAVLILPALLLAGCGGNGRDETNGTSGELPYIVRLEAGGTQIEEVDATDWFSSGGMVSLPGHVPPHEIVRIEFSERMRVPMEVAGADLLWAALDETLEWWEADVAVQREVTVLAGLMAGGFEPGDTYALVFDGLAASPVRDLDGEPLTVRFGAGSLYASEPRTDTRVFTVSPIRIDSASIGDGVVRGVVADEVAAVRLTLGDGSFVTAQRTVTEDHTEAGLALDRFSGSLALEECSCVTAEALAADGSSLGFDVLAPWLCP